MRYIELNPVRTKKMVNHPSKYRWSSYSFNAQGQFDKLVTAHREYKRLGKDGLERQLEYRQLFHAHIAEITLVAIREAKNKAWVLGSERFKKRIEKKLDRSASSEGQGGDRKSEVYQIGVKYQRV